jgi:hypothetical protein
MSQSRPLRCVLAAIASFILYAGLVTLPFAAVPVAAIGLAFGLAEAAIAAAFAILLTGFLLTPPMAMTLAVFLLLPTLALLRRALMSRRSSNEGDDEAHGEDGFSFYPPRFLIEDALLMAAGGAILVFLSFAGTQGGLPNVLAKTMYDNPQIMDTLRTLYDVSTLNDVAAVANWVLVSVFATWPVLLLGGLQLGQAATVFFKRNLRPTPPYPSLTLPDYLAIGLAVSMVLGLLIAGWVGTLFLTLAAIILSAYFLLGLAIIHAISRFWKGRLMFLIALYFFLLMTAWVIIPVSLMGLLDARLNLRLLPRNPDKPSDS